MIVLVASSSQSPSASRVINSIELKNFTALGLGLPSGRSLPAVTRVATSSVEQFSSFATSPANSRAGIVAWQSRSPGCGDFSSAGPISPDTFIPKGAQAIRSEEQNRVNAGVRKNPGPGNPFPANNPLTTEENEKEDCRCDGNNKMGEQRY